MGGGGRDVVEVKGRRDLLAVMVMGGVDYFQRIFIGLFTATASLASEYELQ